MESKLDLAIRNASAGETMSNWIDVHEPGKPKINRNLLFRIDPVRGLIEIVRRRIRTIVDLADFFSSVIPKGIED